MAAQQRFDLPFVAVLPPAHPLTRFKRLSWAQLLRHPPISLEGEYTQILRREVASEPLTFAPGQEVVFMATALSMVSAGIGVTVCLPDARSLVNRYGLQTRPLGTPTARRKCHLPARQDRVISPAARAFSDDLLAYVAQRRWGAMAE